MKKIIFTTLMMVLGLSMANAGTANANFESDSLIASGKSYNILVDMNKDVSFYDRNRGVGLEYVQQLVNNCNKYKATCNIKVVIHAKAFPLLVKTGKINKKIVKPYVNYNPRLIANLQTSGVEFVTSRNSLQEYAVAPTDLLPNISLADNNVFYEANMVGKGFFVIQQ